MEVLRLGRIQPFKCPVNDCQFSKNKIFAEKPQIREHLAFKHDYKQCQEAAVKHNLIPKLAFRGRGVFINLLCDYGIVRGSQ